jgi:hypothetical protein
VTIGLDFLRKSTHNADSVDNKRLALIDRSIGLSDRISSQQYGTGCKWRHRTGVDAGDGNRLGVQLHRMYAIVCAYWFSKS